MQVNTYQIHLCRQWHRLIDCLNTNVEENLVKETQTFWLWDTLRLITYLIVTIHNQWLEYYEKYLENNHIRHCSFYESLCGLDISGLIHPAVSWSDDYQVFHRRQLPFSGVEIKHCQSCNAPMSWHQCFNCSEGKCTFAISILRTTKHILIWIRLWFWWWWWR